MRRIIYPACIILAATIFFSSCKKEVKEITADGISAEALVKIKHQGFSTTDIKKIDEGYLVEGDIVITEDYLNNATGWKTYTIADEEQYHTTNLVSSTKHSTITVSTEGITGALSNAVDAAIKRYNDQNLQITFQRASSGGLIVIKLVNTGQYIASAGFPDTQGNPYPQVKYAKKYSNYSIGFMTTVIAHEIGHCIGFRHTDYMDRSYSCGIGGDEGEGSVGAHRIPGTPAGPDAKSWMLACLSSTTDRPFNSNDKTALAYIY